MGSLTEDYIARADALAPFYANAPIGLFSTTPEPRAWAEGLADAMHREQTRLGVEREFSGNEPVVVTGQQPAVFTGPLYTIYKAITAIKLAAMVAGRTGETCVPIFWLGGEDHDFEEARSAHFLTKHHTDVVLTYSPASPVEGKSMDAVPIEPALRELIDAAAQAVSASEFGPEVAAFLHESLDASTSIADWCGRILAKLFERTPLLFFSPSLPEARRAAVPVVAHAIREPLVTTRLVNTCGERLAALGYEAQVVKGENECAFFLYEEGWRRKVVYGQGKFLLPETGSSFTEGELLARLDASPADFSPNVALRCIVQQCLFPVAAYVAGPGEIAYWAQIKPLFEHFGLPMPVVYPRTRCVLTTVKDNKLLARSGLRIGDLVRPQEEVMARALRSAVRSTGLDLFDAHQPRIDAASQALVLVLSTVRGLSDIAEGYAIRQRGALEWLFDALLKADTVQVETTRKQVERLCTRLAPGRLPQERVYTVCSFLFEHGWELIDRMLAELDVTDFGLQEIEL